MERQASEGVALLRPYCVAQTPADPAVGVVLAARGFITPSDILNCL